MDPFNPTTTPGRKLRTYGRASCTATTATPLRRASSSTQAPDPFVTKEPLVSVADKSKTRATKVDRGKTAGSSARVPVKSGSGSATRTSAGTAAARNGQGAAGKKRDHTQADVFDFPSSEDELLAAAEPWSKRRRLSTPAASRRPSVSVQKKRVEEGGSEARRVRMAPTPARKQARVSVPVPETVRRERKRLKTPAKSTAKEIPDVDVVVKDAPKGNARKTVKRTVPMPTIAESKTPRKPIPAETDGGRKARPRTASIPTATDSKTLRKPGAADFNTGRITQEFLDVDVVDSLFANKPILDAPKLEPTKRPQVLGSPTSKLRNITKHLSPMKKPGTGSLHSNAKTPGAVSRTRLVDALGSKRRYSTDSNDSEAENGRSTSRSPSARLDDTQMTAFDEDHQALTNPRRAPVSNQRVTYARQRSFLTETNRGDGDIDPLGDLTTPLIPESPHKLAKFKSSTSWDLEEDDEGNTTRTIRSVYELRQAGSNARYQGVIETIFEDLEDPSTSLSCKRSGFMQLCTKLTDYQFALKFLSNSLDKRLAKCTSGPSDVISAFLLAYIYALLLSTGSASPIVLRTCHAQIARIAPMLLKEKRDILVVAKQRDANMTKAGYNDLKELGRSIQSSKIWSETKPRLVSPQILALRCTELTIRRIRETGDTVEALTMPVLKQVVQLLLQQSLPDDTESDGLLVLELCLSILESYTVGLGQLEPSQESVLRGLSKLGPLLADLTRQSTDTRRRHLQGLEIRLVLNITNNNSRLCDDFSTPELIRALSEIVLVNFESVDVELHAALGSATTAATAGKGTENFEFNTVIGNGVEKNESLLDTVILALGALINLTEWSGTARRLIHDSHERGTATNTKATKTKTTTTNLVDGFVRLFTEGWEGVSEVSFPSVHTYLPTHNP